MPEECLTDESDVTSQDEQTEGESLSESLKLSDIHEDPKEKEHGSSSYVYFYLGLTIYYDYYIYIWRVSLMLLTLSYSHFV